MDIYGMRLDGHKFADKSGLNTCGLGTLAYFHYVPEGKPAAMLEDVFNAIQWSSNPTPHGSLVFALSATQIKDRQGFLKWLCEHPNTKCMHYYYNDAHGPNYVFLCVHHRFPEQTKPQEQKQLMEVFDLFTFDLGTWRLK